MAAIVIGLAMIGLGVVLTISQPYFFFRLLFVLGAALIVAGIRSIRYNRETERMMRDLRRR